MDKSRVFFFSNTSNVLRADICDVLGIFVVDSPKKYLGLPILWGRSKVEALSFVKDKIGRKIQGWKQNLLSQVGREVLIKFVACVIPTFPMSCFLS